MKAMILAAGRGERMRPLTDENPKPMLKVAGIPLIEHHVKNLAKAGITDIVINHAWLGQKIENYLKDGSQWEVSISYSRETQGALETAGGIINALPLLLKNSDSKTPFLVVNGDVYTEFDFKTLPLLANNCLAHIWLVENPEHNLTGDFCLSNQPNLNESAQLVSNIDHDKTHSLKSASFTFSGIGLYKPEFFSTSPKEKTLPLGPLLKANAEKGLLSGKLLTCKWTDVGTPKRLAELNQWLLG